MKRVREEETFLVRIKKIEMVIRQASVRTQVVKLTPHGDPVDFLVDVLAYPMTPGDSETFFALHTAAPACPVAQVLRKRATQS